MPRHVFLGQLCKLLICCCLNKRPLKKSLNPCSLWYSLHLFTRPPHLSLCYIDQPSNALPFLHWHSIHHESPHCWRWLVFIDRPLFLWSIWHDHVFMFVLVCIISVSFVHVLFSLLFICSLSLSLTLSCQFYPFWCSCLSVFWQCISVCTWNR